MQHEATVGTWVGSHPELSARCLGPDELDGTAVRVEQLLRPVRAQPRLELGAVFRVLAHFRQRHLVGPEAALGGQAVHL